MKKVLVILAIAISGFIGWLIGNNDIDSYLLKWNTYQPEQTETSTWQTAEEAVAIARKRAETSQWSDFRIVDENETFHLINQERAKRGLLPLSWNNHLYEGAKSWSEHLQAEDSELYHDMSGDFAECLYGAAWSNYLAPSETVEAWMESYGHRTILLGNYKIGAIGIAGTTKGNSFFVVTFRCQ